MAESLPVANVASIVTLRGEPDFVNQLRAASPKFASDEFEVELATYLRSRPDLIEARVLWCGDQRWSPSAYMDGTETGWFDAESEPRRQQVRQHPDEAAAVSDFIHRMVASLAES